MVHFIIPFTCKITNCQVTKFKQNPVCITEQHHIPYILKHKMRFFPFNLVLKYVRSSKTCV